MDKAIWITLIIVAGVLVLGWMLLGFADRLVPAQDTIQASGEATIDVIPDDVSISLTIKSTESTSKAAKDKTFAKLNQVTSNLKSAGFEDNEIQTQNFNVYEEFDYSSGSRKSKGFTATHSLIIKFSTSELEKIGTVIDVGIGSGADFGSINFELSQSERNKYEAQATKLAAEDAKLKAEALADGLGKELGKLVSISDTDFGYRPYLAYEASASVSSDAAVVKEETASIAPSEQTVRSSVRVIYKIK